MTRQTPPPRTVQTTNRLRRSGVAVVSGLAVAVLAGCGGGSNAESTDKPGELEFDLQAQGDARIVGARAVLTYVDEQRTRILVDGIDEGEAGGGGATAVELRRGSCAEPDEIMAQLPALRGAGVEKTVEIAMAELYEGEYSIHVGLPGSDRETIACGDVPDEPPG